MCSSLVFPSCQAGEVSQSNLVRRTELTPFWTECKRLTSKLFAVNCTGLLFSKSHRLNIIPQIPGKQSPFWDLTLHCQSCIINTTAIEAAAHLSPNHNEMLNSAGVYYEHWQRNRG
jgi:hypothetical protein